MMFLTAMLHLPKSAEVQAYASSTRLCCACASRVVQALKDAILAF